MISNSTSSSTPGISSPAAALAIAIVGLGALAVGLVAAPYRSFDLDRFFAPKELALHATALLSALPLLIGRRRIAFSGVDVLLVLFLILSAASAAFAGNHWLATRSLAVTWSSLVVFWAMSAAASGRSERERAVAATLVIAVLATVAAALAQAYGIDSRYFSTTRAPGGTLGNRNFVAHLAAIATPLLIVAAVGARRRLSALVATVALAVTSAVLVLSRTRAAWIALAACAVVLLPGVWRARTRWKVVGLRRRLLMVALAVTVTILAAVFVPNSLAWRSKSPYLDSVKSMTDYSEGSGRGRLVQYENTLKIALHHPLLGVGPGNWPVVYPATVHANDPSLDTDTGMTENPWPSSDWMAFISERGVPAVAVLALALLALLADAGGQIVAARDFEAHLRGLALAGVVIATAVAGAFDAVLLLPPPALIAFAVFGALRSPPARRSMQLSAGARNLLLGTVAFVGVAAATRSALMVTAMANYERGDVSAAAREDPGSYRIQMRLAESAQTRGRCDLVRVHASAARALFPNAPAPRRMLGACPRSATR
ncbi:MAG TPA: O-antigen ligase family protein [Gemmatimonadaceae bacterium]